MKENTITTHIEASYGKPISEIKVTDDDEIIAIRAITKLTANWYPNEYHFISEELFKHLLALSLITTKNTH